MLPFKRNIKADIDIAYGLWPAVRESIFIGLLGPFIYWGGILDTSIFTFK